MQYKLETKASSHEGQCIPAGSSVSQKGVNYCVNNNHAPFPRVFPAVWSVCSSVPGLW